MVEGARLESVCRGNLTAGSNPALSASSEIPGIQRSKSDRGNPISTEQSLIAKAIIDSVPARSVPKSDRALFRQQTDPEGGAIASKEIFEALIRVFGSAAIA